GAFEPGGWIVQGNAWIEGRKAVAFARTKISARSLRRTVAFLSARLPPVEAEPAVKLYVTRDSGDGRNLRNEAELRRALVERGFMAVDPGTLPWIGQVRLFWRGPHRRRGGGGRAH